MRTTTARGGEGMEFADVVIVAVIFGGSTSFSMSQQYRCSESMRRRRAGGAHEYFGLTHGAYSFFTSSRSVCISLVFSSVLIVANKDRRSKRNRQTDMKNVNRQAQRYPTNRAKNRLNSNLEVVSVNGHRKYPIRNSPIQMRL